MNTMFDVVDTFFKAYEQSLKVDNQKYPPYNILSTTNEKSTIEFAVAGFSRDDIEVTVSGDNLIIRGQKLDDTEKDYIYKGISTKKFTKSFTLNQCEVGEVSLDNGILKIELNRIIPEEKKPKKLEIK